MKSLARGWGLNGGKHAYRVLGPDTADSAPFSTPASPTPSLTPPLPGHGAGATSGDQRGRKIGSGPLASVRNDAKLLAAQLSDGLASGTWLVGLCIILGAGLIAVAIMVLAQAVSMG